MDGGIPRLQWDFRLVKPELVVSAETLVQIPDVVRKCVAFLAFQARNQGKILGGTAFFVAVPIEGTEVSLKCIVTAKHCIEGIKKLSDDGIAYIRVNLKSGTSTWVTTDPNAWVYNDDPRVDVAVLVTGIDNAILDHKWLPVSGFATDALIAEQSIGIGDELFFPGLFTEHSGENVNIPIVRTGSIAAMPHERVSTKLGMIRAYLAEARSIGGLSGSPVFLYIGPFRRTNGGHDMVLSQPQFPLIGMIHGHFGVREPLEAWLDDTTPEAALETPEKDNRQRLERSLNMGIAIVIPADEILDTLNHPKLVAQRESVRQTIELKKELPELDSGEQSVDDSTLNVRDGTLPSIQPPKLPKGIERRCFWNLTSTNKAVIRRWTRATDSTKCA